VRVRDGDTKACKGKRERGTEKEKREERREEKDTGDLRACVCVCAPESRRADLRER